MHPELMGRKTDDIWVVPGSHDLQLLGYLATVGCLLTPHYLPTVPSIYNLPTTVPRRRPILVTKEDGRRAPSDGGD